MDQNRFDSLARHAAGAFSRRGVLGLILAGAPGALALELKLADARKKNRHGNGK